MGSLGIVNFLLSTLVFLFRDWAERKGVTRKTTHRSSLQKSREHAGLNLFGKREALAAVTGFLIA